MYFVYILQHDSTKETYVGSTGDMKRRLIQHNSHDNKSTSRKDGTWVLIYTEIYRSKTDALTRERRLKAHGSGKRELFKRLANSLLDT